jgi:hypothetical protein
MKTTDTARKLAGILLKFWRFNMTNENLQPLAVSEMLKLTGDNTQAFLYQVAEHIEKLEMEVSRLTARVTDLEGTTSDPTAN